MICKNRRSEIIDESMKSGSTENDQVPASPQRTQAAHRPPAPRGGELTVPKSNGGQVAIYILAAVAIVLLFFTVGCSDGSSGDASSSAAVSSQAAAASADGSDSGAAEAGDASSVASSSEVAGESDEATGGLTSTQTIGDAKTTGTMEIPSDWKDRSGDYDENLIDDTDLVYYVDPTTEYTSGALSHFSFSQSVEMRVYPASYDMVANDTMSEWEAQGIYDDIDSETTTFNGHAATVMTCTIPEDGVYVCDVAIDRDDDGHATVLIKAQGTPSNIESVLGYVSTWSY